MIKAFVDKNNPSNVIVKVNGREGDVLLELKDLLRGIYKSLSEQGKKVLINNWDGIYKPDSKEEIELYKMALDIANSDDLPDEVKEVSKDIAEYIKKKYL